MKLSVIDRYLLTPILIKENEELKKEIIELKNKLDENDDKWRAKFLAFTDRVMSQFSLLTTQILVKPNEDDFKLTPEEEVMAKERIKRQQEKLSMVGALGIMDSYRDRYFEEYAESLASRADNNNLSSEYKEALRRKAARIKADIGNNSEEV